MQHLFGKIYLQHISHYANNKPHEILLETEKLHPLSKIEGVEYGKIPSFATILKDRFEDSYDKYWEHLFEAETRLNIYCDSKIYTSLFIQYYKSVLPNASAEDLHRLYILNLMNTRFRGMLNRQRLAQPYKTFAGELPYLTLEEFRETVQTIPVVSFLQNCSRHDFGFEILMANFFLQKESEAGLFFLAKLKKFAWKTWFNDMEILKLDILNAGHQLPDLLDVKVSEDLLIENPDRFERLVTSNKLLAWMSDERFNENNIDHVLSTYDKNDFKYLTDRLHPILGVIHQHQAQSESFAQGDHVLQTDLVFDGKFEEYLMKDIDRGLGCIFTNDLLFYKSNQLLVGFIYDKVRTKRTSDLSFLELAKVTK